jgi:hypothetical protein
VPGRTWVKYPGKYWLEQPCWARENLCMDKSCLRFHVLQLLFGQSYMFHYNLICSRLLIHVS